MTLARRSIVSFLLAGLLSTLSSYPSKGAGVYWTSDFSIGHANLDGTGVNANFISNLPKVAEGITVAGNYVYWTATNSQLAPADNGAIGRANLDGTGVNPNFISNVSPGPAFPS